MSGSAFNWWALPTLRLVFSISPGCVAAPIKELIAVAIALLSNGQFLG